VYSSNVIEKWFKKTENPYENRESENIRCWKKG
jgi:hypothetical protein